MKLPAHILCADVNVRGLELLLSQQKVGDFYTLCAAALGNLST